MTEKTYSEFPVKIFEIVLTAVFIGSFLAILTAMAEANFKLMIFPWGALVLILGPIYLVWTYKIVLEEKELLSKPFVRYLIYFISVSAIFLSLAQLQEIFPILKIGISSYSELGTKYREESFFHPLFTAIILFSFLVLYWFAYNKRGNRKKRVTTYNEVIIGTFCFIELLFMFLLPYSIIERVANCINQFPILREWIITATLIFIVLIVLAWLLTKIFHSLAERISS